MTAAGYGHTLAAAVCLAGAMALGCPRPVPPMPPQPPASDCAAAEATFTRLGCVDSRGQAYATTKTGQRFADVCRMAADAGVDVNPECIAHATTCAEATVCLIR